MRVAPPVQASSCSGWRWPSIQLTLVAAATSIAAWWAAAQWREPDGWQALGSLLAGLAAVALARRHVVEPVRRLGWDGNGWSLAQPGGEPVAGQVTLMIDLGGWMLLRFRPDGAGRRGSTWLPMSERSAAGAWHALRVALHGPQPVRQDTEPARPGA